MADDAEAGLSPGSLDRLLPVLYGRPYTLLDHLAENGLLFLSDPAACRESLAAAGTLFAEEAAELFESGIAFPGCDRWIGSFDDLLCETADRRSAVLDTFARTIPDLRLRGLASVQALALAPWGGELAALLEDIRPYLHNGTSVTVLLPTKRGCDALLSDLAAEGIPARYAESPTFEEGVQVTDLTLSAGFEYPAAKAAVIGHARAAAPARKLQKSGAPPTQSAPSRI